MPLTEYVSTRWYRAPELILASKFYNEKVDVFALAANMAELYLGRPIFPGRSTNDQFETVVSILGAPKQSDWPDGYRLAQMAKTSIPQSYGNTDISKL